MDNLLRVIFLLHLAVPGVLLLNLLTGQSLWHAGQKVAAESVQGLGRAVLPCILLSVAAFITAHRIIPSIAAMTQAAGMSGKDLNKKDGKIM